MAQHPNLLVILSLLALQLALAAALLAPVLEGLAATGWAPRAHALARLAGLLPILLALFLFFALQQLPQELIEETTLPAPLSEGGPLSPHFLVMLAFLLGYAIQLIFFQLWSPASGADRFMLGLWLACGVLMQAGFNLFASDVLADFYVRKYFGVGLGSPIPFPMLALGLTLAGVTGGIGMAVAGGGVLLACLRQLPAEWGNCVVRRLGWLLATAIVLRALAVIYSVLLGALTHPIGVSHFFSISLAPASTLLIVRLGLGLLMPLLYALLALEAQRAGDLRQALFQFIPAAILIIMNEIIAAGLTVGMWGLAF